MRKLVALFFFIVVCIPVSTYGLTRVPVGGKIFAKYECACSGGFVIFVGPPRPGVFLIQPGVSRLFKGFSPVVGAWVVGNAIPGGVCSALSTVCFPISIQGTIRNLGTGQLFVPVLRVR